MGWVVSKAVNPLELLSSEAEADTFREGAGAYFLVGFFEDVKVRGGGALGRLGRGGC